MNGTFNVNEYWLKRGQTYRHEKRVPPEYHRLQERFLLEVLQAARIPVARILEIGCGFGRVTKLLAETWPSAHIVALDLSPDQLASAQRYCGEPANIQFQQFDFYSGLPFPGRDYDAVMAIEVFLHHPRDVVKGLFGKLAEISRHIVSLDWSEKWPWATPEHVWVHDYPALYAEAGLECATFRLPEKVEGKQQKLFIAAKELGETLRRLERELDATIAADPSAPPPEAPKADWPEHVQHAAREIRELIPRGDTLILVNDDQWGNEAVFADRRLFPFLEKEGRYWGPPADDATAIRELERLQRAGAGYIVFASDSFWWLEHYAEFRRYLRERHSSVLENERLVIFKLNV